MPNREHEQKALVEIGNTRALGLKLSGVVAAFGVLAFLMGENSFAIVALLVIAVVSIGTYFEDKCKLQAAYLRDLDESDPKS